MRQTRPVEFALATVRFAYTKRQYPKRLKLFFDHIGLQGNSLEEQAQAFLSQARREGKKKNNNGNPYWIEDNKLSFLDFHKERILIKKEIKASTLGTYFWPIKTFYDAHERDLPRVHWKRLAKTLPRANSYSMIGRSNRRDTQASRISRPQNKTTSLCHMLFWH